jgi:hypothetical protein
VAGGGAGGTVYAPPLYRTPVCQAGQYQGGLSGTAPGQVRHQRVPLAAPGIAPHVRRGRLPEDKLNFMERALVIGEADGSF